MTVFVVHPLKNGIGIEDAKRFGEIRYVNDRYVYGDEITEDKCLPSMFQQALILATVEFNSGRDYILIAGDHLQLAALCGMVGRRHLSFMVLRWVRDANAYMPVRIHT